MGLVMALLSHETVDRSVLGNRACDPHRLRAIRVQQHQRRHGAWTEGLALALPLANAFAGPALRNEGSTMKISRAAYSITFVVIGAAFAGGCSSSDGAAVSDACLLPLGLTPKLVYPKSGATVTPSNSGIVLYGNVGMATVPIDVVGTRANVDTPPTSLPSPLPSPTATPPAGEKSWGLIHAVEIRPLLPPGKYDVEATVTLYSCPPGPTQRQVQVRIGRFRILN
jgi:hypothetical protein